MARDSLEKNFIGVLEKYTWENKNVFMMMKQPACIFWVLYTDGNVRCILVRIMSYDWSNDRAQTVGSGLGFGTCYKCCV